MPSLYVTEPGAMVAKEGGRLLVTKGDEVLLAVPAARVDGVVLVGGVGVTTPALAALLDGGIGLVLLRGDGRFRGRLSPPLAKHVALRRAQYRRADDEALRLALGRAFVAGKLGNARTLCLRWDQTNADPVALGAAAELRRLRDRLPTAPDRPSLMGLEGEAARAYFALFRHVLRDPWPFPRRARRPPPDPVNALLSVAYTLLHESCYAALEAVGLDPYCGFLHEERYGRASLAVDLMEEFRPLIADSVVLRLLNTRMVALGDFGPGPEGRGVVLGRAAWRAMALEYGRRLGTLVRPPGQERRTTYRKLLEVQARRLRRVIEGEVEAYESFLAK